MKSRRGRRTLLAVGLVVLFVSAGLAAIYLGREKPAASKFVALYVTDLPGGLEGLRVSILAATVGPSDVPLKVEKEVVELSKLHGPTQGLLVASGDVPRDAGESVSLVFGGAEGLRDGAWIPVAVPQNRLTLQSALVNGSFERNAVLFDFNLNASIAVQENGDVSFQPYVETAYEYHSTVDESTHTVYEGDVTNMDWDVAIDASVSVKVDFPEQFIDSLADEIVDGLCRRMPACTPGPLTGGGRITHGETACVEDSLEDTASSRSPSPFQMANCIQKDAAGDDPGLDENDPSGLANQPPRTPFDPRPADQSTGIDASPVLSWAGGDPDDDAVVYELTIDGKSACPRLQVAECRLPSLVLGSVHSWHVTAIDEHGDRSMGPTWTFTVAQEGQPVNRAPSAPSQPTPLDGFVASNAAAQSVRWVGTDPDGDAIEYQTLLGSSLGTLVVACAWSRTASCMTPSFAADGKQYWRVDVRDAKGATIQGPVWTFTITGAPTNAAPEIPGAPSPPSAATTSNLNPTLTWSGGDPDGDAVTYQVTVNGVTKCTTSQRTCALSALTNGAAYTWSVTATDTPKVGAAKSSAGPAWTFTVALGAQNQAPLGVSNPVPAPTATGVTDAGLLSWSGSDPDGDPLEYQVFFGTSETPTVIQCTWSSQTSCARPSLVAGTTYYWRVDARDASATTPGPVWSFVANRVPDVPSTPGPVDAKQNPPRQGDGSVTLSWTGSDPDGGSLEYRVFADSNQNPPLALRCDWAASTTCSSGIHLEPDVWTYWRVEARDGAGQIRIGPTWKFQVFAFASGYQPPLTDSTELHDNSATKSTPELERTLTFTPGLNQYVIIHHITGNVAYDGTGKSATLSTRVLGLDPAPVQIAVKAPSQPSNDPLPQANPDGVSNVDATTVAYCSFDEYGSGGRSVQYQAGLGQAVSVEFFLHYSPPADVQSQQESVTDVCLDDTIVTYEVVTVPD